LTSFMIPCPQKCRRAPSDSTPPYQKVCTTLAVGPRLAAPQRLEGFHAAVAAEDGDGVEQEERVVAVPPLKGIGRPAAVSGLRITVCKKGLACSSAPTLKGTSENTVKTIKSPAQSPAW
jgi:hypothetical protein